MSRTNFCAVSDCDKTIPRSMLMCRSHWFSVPKVLRDQVWDTYHRNGVLSDKYWDAREAAIHSVEIT